MVDPVEFDSAFGNLLNDMMIAMEKKFMENEVNFELQALAEEAREEVVSAQYEDMIDELVSIHYMNTYSAYSYDEYEG